MQFSQNFEDKDDEKEQEGENNRGEFGLTKITSTVDCLRNVFEDSDLL